MDNLSEIKKRIKNIAGKSEQNMFTAKVEGVDGDTCSVSVDGLTLTDVRLRAVINGERSKLIITPVVGSYVLVADLSGGNYSELVVMNVSEIDNITLDVDNTIVINGGENAGMVKINELTNKLNGLKDTVNRLINAFNTHTHNVSTMGTAAAQTGTAAVTLNQVSLAAEFVQTDYENDKIKH